MGTDVQEREPVFIILARICAATSMDAGWRNSWRSSCRVVSMTKCYASPALRNSIVCSDLDD